MKKAVIIGVVLIGIFSLGLVIFTCNPISNKCHAKTHNEQSKNAVLAKNLNPAEFKSAIDSGNYKVIDIRTAEEFNQGHIDGATQIDFYKSQEFSSYLDSLDKNQKYLIYCRSGNRSGQALNIMKAKGFTSVSDLAGGYNSWTSSGN